MNRSSLFPILSIVIGIAGLVVSRPNAFQPLPPAQPNIPPLVQPLRKPLLPILPRREGIDKATVGGRVMNGVELQVDLPNEQHLRNLGGSDGAGLCVFTSISHAARWQNVPILSDFRDWMTRKPGGGYPSKVDAMIREKAGDTVDYLQVEGNDLSIIELALATGRPVSNTYGYSPTGRYGGRYVAHMVSTVHAKDGTYVVLDNNYPGDTKYEWMNKAQYLRAYKGNSQGWCVILLNPPPPPIPYN